MIEAIHFKLNDKPINLRVDGERMFCGFFAPIWALRGRNMVVERVYAVPVQFL